MCTALISLTGENEMWRIFAFFGVVLASLIAGRIARLAMERARSRTSGAEPTALNIIVKALSRSMVLVVFAVGFRFGILFLIVGPRLQSILADISGILNAAAVGYVLYCLVDVVDYYLKNMALRTGSKVDDVLAPLVGKSIRITILVLVVLNVAVVISGKDFVTILASLGVGGLAVALAGQDTIKNFFGSLVIFGDKPFEIGDRIVVDGHDGPVESVGFRSTRIRTLEGHLVTVPNASMVDKTVQNIGKRPFIRRLANITITYDTSSGKVDRAVEILKEILADHEGMNPELPPRVYFNEFNDCSLNILMIYWYHPPDYWKYMEFTDRVNREILRRFNEEGIEFAFPTQTVYLANDERRQLALRMLGRGRD